MGAINYQAFFRSKITYSAILSILLGFTPLSKLSAKPLVYLYINASEGNASGGHTALRFGPETFHFQHFEGRVIRLVKNASTDFDYQYRFLENRTIQQANIELSDEHYKQLRNHFNLGFLIQKQQDAIIKEINLNIALLHKQDQNSLLSIHGAGLFAKNVVSRETNTSANQTLQEYIQLKQGSNFLNTRIQQLNQKIKALKADFNWLHSSHQLSENTFVSIPYSFASQYLDTASKLLFLKTLINSSPLKKQVYFSPQHPIFKLSSYELEQLRKFYKQLRNELLSLLNSRRPDWGSSAFTLYARLLSLSHSIQSEKFVFLDSYAENSATVPFSEVNSYRSLFQAQKNHALEKSIKERKQLFYEQKKITEKNYSRFEMLSNYYFERERGLNYKHSIRISGEQRLPSKSTPLPVHLLPKLTPSQTEKYLHALAHYKKTITQQLQALYHYDLFSRNCVTEIFTMINKANINNPQIDELANLIEGNLIAFIPFGSFLSLPSVHQQLSFPSYRQQQLANMNQQENDALVYLREFNTLSSRDYKFNNKDSTFLFFTDDAVWSRPLFGIFNLLTATSVGIFGSVTLPFDTGKALNNSAMGILMSLPELVFFNIRKGSYKHLSPPEQLY